MQDQHWQRGALAPFLVGVALSACSTGSSNPIHDAVANTPNGAVASGGAGAGGGTAATSLAVGVDPVQRMKRREVINTLRQLLSDPSLLLTDTYPDDAAGSESGFVLAANNVSTVDVREFRILAEAVAAKATQNLTKLTGCHTVDDACLAVFVKNFGRRAYRRPLADAEVADFIVLHSAALAAGDSPGEAVAVVLESFLQSPHFMIKFELTEQPPASDGGVLALTTYQLASRLAFFLGGSAPDDELNSAVDAGQLAVPADIEREAQRLLAEESRASDMLADFSLGWLELGRLTGLRKDLTLYPNWTEQTNDDLRRALGLFVSDIVLRGDGTLRSLLTSTQAFANERLAPLYGQTLSGDSLVKVDLDPTRRIGLLMQAPFLATTAAEAGSLPPRRGARIYKHLFCGELGAPPMVIPPLPPADLTLKTTRQRFEGQHSQQACAKGCHNLIDPMGFPFESFAGGGDYRTQDNGEAVNTAGSVTTPGGTTIAYRDGVEFVGTLAKLPEVHACYAAHWYRYALGRRETEPERPNLADLASQFSANDTHVKRLLVSIATSRAFRFRSLVEGETP